MVESKPKPVATPTNQTTKPVSKGQQPINHKKTPKVITTPPNQIENQPTMEKFTQKLRKPEPNPATNHPLTTSTNLNENQETKPNTEDKQETRTITKPTPAVEKQKPVLKQPTLKLQPKTSKPETKNTTTTTQPETNQQQQNTPDSKVKPVIRKPTLTLQKPKMTEKPEPVMKTSPTEYKPSPPKPKSTSKLGKGIQSKSDIKKFLAQKKLERENKFKNENIPGPVVREPEHVPPDSLARTHTVGKQRNKTPNQTSKGPTEQQHQV